MSTLVVFLLLVADGGPPIGAFTDAAACTRSATKMTEDMQAKDPRYSGKNYLRLQAARCRALRRGACAEVETQLIRHQTATQRLRGAGPPGVD